jgi:phage shock protein A
MSIFRRTTDIVTANLNDLVDRWEDPERMLRQAMRDLEATLAVTSAAVARSIATEKLLAGTQAQQAAQADRWQQRANQALDEADQELARRAIARQLNYEHVAATTGRQLAEAHEVNNSLRRRLDLLRDRHAAARTKLTVLSAQQSVANAQLRASMVTKLPETEAGAWGRFQRFFEQIELAQGELVARLELETPGETLEADFKLRANERAIDLELARLNASRKPEGT